MTFKWLTSDGQIRYKFIPKDHEEEILDFIGWLETDLSVIRWW